jgi:hypothetical protein
MANEYMIQDKALIAETEIREYVMQLLRTGYTMENVITALQAVKVEMAAAMQYEKAIHDALYRP